MLTLYGRSQLHLNRSVAYAKQIRTLLVAARTSPVSAEHLAPLFAAMTAEYDVYLIVWSPRTIVALNVFVLATNLVR